MGKDVRGIERGECACGYFMRSDGETCGCCGCLPTRHSKNDARYSSYSVGGTSGGGTRVKVQVQRSGKIKIWGGSRTQRANILNSQIVFCLNSTCPFGPHVPTSQIGYCDF